MTWAIIRTEDGTADKMKRLLGNALLSASQMKNWSSLVRIEEAYFGKEQARSPILEGFGHNICDLWSFSRQQYKSLHQEPTPPCNISISNLSHHSHPREQHR